VAHNQLAVSLESFKRHEEALKHFRRILEITQQLVRRLGGRGFPV
jgi:hypothetical protein